MSDEYYDNELLNTSILVEGVVWQPVDNDTFLSTNEACNETQYFSMLDSCNSTTLNDISGVEGLTSFDEEPCTVSTEPDFFRIEGSEDLFAFDIAVNGDGNLQRYRYRLRLNDNGEYEGVPETYEVISLHSEDLTETNEDTVKNEVESVETVDIPDEDSNGLCVSEDVETDDGMMFTEVPNDEYKSCAAMFDIKLGITEQSSPANKVESFSDCKVEDARTYTHFDESSQNSFNNIDSDTNEHIDLYTLNTSCSTDDASTSTIINNSTNHNVSIHNQCIDAQPTPVSPDHQNTLSDDSDRDAADVNNLSEKQESLDTVHVTSDTEPRPTESPIILEETEDLVASTYILQLPQQIISPSKRILRSPKIHYSINQEKENLAAIPQIQLIKTNPRSLLKSSYVFVEQNHSEIKPSESPKFDKRLLKNKEFAQARLFNNYIAQTTIQHAPVRQHRLPRKQTIKPVERNDEEIIVQEVVVSSKGFVETSEDGVVKSKVPLKVTELVQLSDSDEDYRPRRTSKKKTAPKQVEIIINDSDDEEKTIPNDTNTISNVEESPLTKKRRGRPPKRATNSSEKTLSPSKKQKPTTVPTDACSVKARWKCERCPKSFPSQGSLTSHMQSHNYPELKFKCSHCDVTFKNSVLLTRHLKTHNAEIHSCFTCKRKFGTQTELAAHKRSHIKDLMIKATDVLKCSPKTTNKSPTKNQCEFCPKAFSTSDLLKAHMKTHMQFSCVNCPLKFASKLMLESHVRTKCVKSTRVSLIPRLALSGSSETFKQPESSIVKKTLSCDKCAQKFVTHTNLYKHKVLVHNFDTPDKRQIIAENSAKKTPSKSAHKSIPANDQLKKVYTILRSKLDL